MQMREKVVGKSRNTVFFQWFVAPAGRKVGSLKRRVRSQLARWEMKNCTPLRREAHFEVKMYKTHHSRTTLEVEMSKKCTPLWREAHFEVKMHKAHHCRTTFGSWDVKKVHAVVALSTLRSQNVQNTPRSDHFWKFRCGKSARRCGAKHISKWKCTKHHMFAPLFGGSDVEKVHAVVVQSTFRSQHVKNTRVSDHFWRFRCRFASLHYTTLHSTTLHYTTLHYTTTTTTQLHSTTIHSATLNYITLHCITLHYTTLHYITLHYTTFHYTSLHCTTLHSTTLQLQLHNYTPLQYTPLH